MVCCVCVCVYGGLMAIYVDTLIRTCEFRCVLGGHTYERVHTHSQVLNYKHASKIATAPNSIQFNSISTFNWIESQARTRTQTKRKETNTRNFTLLSFSSQQLVDSFVFFPLISFHIFFSLDCCCCCMWFLRLRALFICLFVWILQFLSYSSSVAIVDSHKASWTAWMGQLM